jgi:hypothetical protein
MSTAQRHKSNRQRCDRTATRNASPTTPSAFDADGLDRVWATSILLHFLAVKQVAGPDFAPHAAYAHTDPGTYARNGLQRDGSEVRTPSDGLGPGDQHLSACTAVFAVDAQRPHVARPDTGQCNTQHGPCGAYTPAARRRSCHADDGLGSPMRAHQQAAWPGSVRYAPVAAPTCVLFPRCEHSLCARTRFVFLCIHSKRVSLPRTYAFRSCARTLFQSVYAPERVSY